MTKQKLVFATHNYNKLKEVQEMLGEQFELISLTDLDLHDEIPETESTLEGNARLKAKYVHNRYGEDVFADDTGLEVYALNGEPGVFSARYAGPGKSSSDNIEKLLNALKGVADRRARFRTVIALFRGEEEHLFEGIVEGEIIQELRGTGGFGYDPVFRPVGFEATFSEMSAFDKNRISHRGRAIAKLVEYLKQRQ